MFQSTDYWVNMGHCWKFQYLCGEWKEFLLIYPTKAKINKRNSQKYPGIESRFPNQKELLRMCDGMHILFTFPPCIHRMYFFHYINI